MGAAFPLIFLESSLFHSVIRLGLGPVATLLSLAVVARRTPEAFEGTGSCGVCGVSGIEGSTAWRLMGTDEAMICVLRAWMCASEMDGATAHERS